MAPLSSPGQPLTVSDQGVWIDGNMQAPGGGSDGYDFTLYYDIAEGKVTASWCDAHATGGEALCTHPFGARFGRLAGYRSFAFDGPGFGSRIVTNPLAPGGEDSTNMGCLPEPRRHHVSADARRGRRRRPRRRVLQPERRLAGRAGADHLHAPCPSG